MKRRVLIMLLTICLLLAFSACGCAHDWEEADCDDPKTCVLCGETEGESLGHEWEDANCTTAKTCEECGKTKGQPLGHNWKDATCTEAKTCSGCGETEGEAIGHQWQPATTEAPKTCEECGETEGDKINVDSRFTTASTMALYGTWEETATIDAKDLGLVGISMKTTQTTTYSFDNMGNLVVSCTIADKDTYLKNVRNRMVEEFYYVFQQQGYDATAANSLMVQSYGMNVEEYSDYMMEEYSVCFYGEGKMVYYVSGSRLYTAESWNGDFSYATLAVNGDKVTITSDGESIVLTKAK